MIIIGKISAEEGDADEDEGLISDPCHAKLSPWILSTQPQRRRPPYLSGSTAPSGLLPLLLLLPRSLPFLNLQVPLRLSPTESSLHRLLLFLLKMHEILHLKSDPFPLLPHPPGISTLLFLIKIRNRRKDPFLHYLHL